MKQKTSVAKRLLLYSLGIIGVLTILHLLFQYINISYNNEAFGNLYEVTNRLDFDDEASIPTWYSQFLFLALAFFAGIAAYIERKKKPSYWVWVLVVIASIFGSIDEVSTLHETGLQGLHLLFFDENTPTLLANAWVIIVPFVLLFASVIAFKARKVLPKRFTMLFILSAGVYLTGAIGVDIATSILVDANRFVEQGIFVALEEVSELAGLSLAVYTTVSYLETFYAKRFVRICRRLRTE